MELHPVSAADSSGVIHLFKQSVSEEFKIVKYKKGGKKRIILYKYGDMYEGGWDDFDFTTNGKKTFSNGEWKDGKRHGRGKMTFPNGHVY